MTMITAKEAAKNVQEATKAFREGLLDVITNEITIRSLNRETTYCISTEDLSDDDIIFLICELTAAEYSFTVEDNKITLDWNNKLKAANKDLIMNEIYEGIKNSFMAETYSQVIRDADTDTVKACINELKDNGYSAKLITSPKKMIIVEW